MEISKEQLALVNERIAQLLRADSFYGHRLRQRGVDGVASAEDFRRLPFSEKKDLRDAYPLGLMSVPEEKIVRGTLATIVKDIEGKNIDRTAMIVVSRCLGASYDLSRLYAPEFSHMFREASK